MNQDSCGVCGGDGRITTAHQTTSCPACRGSGRRSDSLGVHDVTKTKPEHHHGPGSKGAKTVKKMVPSTPVGRELMAAVQASAITGDIKKELTQSIIDYEERKGTMTKTFARLLRRKLRDLGG